MNKSENKIENFLDKYFAVITMTWAVTMTSVMISAYIYQLIK